MARVISLMLGVIAMGVGSVFPFVLARQATGLNQSILLVIMIGMAGAFIHGTGFLPRPRFLQFLASPIFTWPVLIFGFGLMTTLR